MASFLKFGWRSQSPLPRTSVPDNHQEPERIFFENQCRVLREQISLVKEISSDSLWGSNCSGRELHRVVKLGETLIEECQIGTCAHKAYLREEERAKAFEEASKEILWCISVVAYIHNICSLRRLSVSALVDEFPQAVLSEREQYVMQRAAFADAKVLRSELGFWTKNHECSAKECGRPQKLYTALCLGAQIQTGWDSQREAGVPRTLEEFKGNRRSSPWTTVQNSLQDVRQIGQGASGKVFETRWLGDTYAKKEVDVTNREDFADEVKALAKLNHPHIVKVYAACSEPSRSCFFLMEKMPCNLRTLMNSRMNQLGMNRPFSIMEAMDLMLQLSEAMSYMNSQGMVHRDLKSENILVKPLDDPELCKKGFVIGKLADFELAKVENEVTWNMTRNTGTKWWMAPEVFKAHKEENLLVEVFPRKADVYSYGIVCSEILTGNVPYYNHSVREHRSDLYKLITDQDNPLRPELPGDCPKSLACLIRDCWHTDAVTRPTFVEISTALRYFKVLVMTREAGKLEDFYNLDWRTVRARLGNRTSCSYTVQTHDIFKDNNRLESENRTLRKELEDERKARQLSVEALEEEQMKLNKAMQALQTKTAAVDGKGAMPTFPSTRTCAEVRRLSSLSEFFYDFRVTFYILLEPLSNTLAFWKYRGRALLGSLTEWIRIPARSNDQQVPSRSMWRVESKDLKSGCFIGQGCSGFFYKATWSGLRILTLLARKDIPGVPTGVFENEVARLVELDHPNVVRNFCWTVDKRSCTLVMEFVKDDLYTVVQKKKEALWKVASSSDSTSVKKWVNGITSPFMLLDALSIILQIATGVEYLHHAGIFHGDLKPNNILVNLEVDPIVVKVADFGLSKTKRMATLISEHAFCYRMIEWSAPEVFEDYFASMGEDLDYIWAPRSDMSTASASHSKNFPEISMMKADSYSFALTCAYMLGGEMWDANLSPSDLRLRITVDDLRPKLPSECPGTLVSLISSCWDANPAERPTFSVIRNKLEEIIKDQREVE